MFGCRSTSTEDQSRIDEKGRELENKQEDEKVTDRTGRSVVLSKLLGYGA